MGLLRCHQSATCLSFRRRGCAWQGCCPCRGSTCTPLRKGPRWASSLGPHPPQGNGLATLRGNNLSQGLALQIEDGLGRSCKSCKFATGTRPVKTAKHMEGCQSCSCKQYAKVAECKRNNSKLDINIATGKPAKAADGSLPRLLLQTVCESCRVQTEQQQAGHKKTQRESLQRLRHASEPAKLLRT